MQEGVLISRFDGSGSDVEQKLGSRIVKRKRSESSKLRIWVENLPTFLGSHHCMYQFFFIFDPQELLLSSYKTILRCTVQSSALNRTFNMGYVHVKSY